MAASSGPTSISPANASTPGAQPAAAQTPGAHSAESLKERYLHLLLRSGALRFGDFTTKSGRQSPYFFNTGYFDSGATLGGVADLYAELIAAHFGDQVENLFGPAYKGIPLAILTADRLTAKLGRDISYTFNRKEAKTHGEGGNLVGRSYRGGEKVVVVEDVVTGGTSFRDMLPLLRASQVDVIGLVVGVDRQERGQGEAAALAEASAAWGVPALSIITVSEVVAKLADREVLGKQWVTPADKARIDAYLAQYGVV